MPEIRWTDRLRKIFAPTSGDALSIKDLAAPAGGTEAAGDRSAVLADLVREFYLAALWRGADDDGLAFHVGLLGSAGDPLHRAATMLGDFRHSAEARRLRSLMTQGNEGRADSWTLGTHCYAAAALNATGLRVASYPFDWIFSSAPMVLHCLQDGFATFLDPAHYAQTHDRGVEHLFYRDAFGVETVFAHRDPRIPDNHLYFRRCVDRMYERLAADGSSATMVSDNPGRDAAHFEGLATYFDRTAPNTTFTMICVEPPGADGMAATGFTTDRKAGNHRLVRYRPSAPMLAMGFTNPIDDLMIRAFLIGS